MSRYATQAVEIYDGMGEYLKSAQCVAMVELERMPELGLPNESKERNVIGGYLLKSTPISAGISYTWEEAEGRRNAAFAKMYGCPLMTNLFAYLFRTKTLLRLPADVGTSWTDEFDPMGRFFGWGTWEVSTDASVKKLVAESVIESREEKVVVPAGSFDNCLKLVTKIQPAGGKYAVTHRERTYSGKRTIWFAPGVGIVQIRYECDDILLVDYDVRSESDEYLPLDVDNRWRYQWVCGDREWNTPAMYNEIVRVTAKSDGNNYIACAAYRFELEKQSQKEHHRNLLHIFRHTGDREGEKFALLDLCEITREDEKEESIKYHEQLHKLSVESSDKIYELRMQSALEILRGGDEYASKLKLEGEILEVHRASGNRMAECKALESIARLHRKQNHYKEAIPYYESAIKINAELGDIIDGQTVCQAEADLCRQAAEDLEKGIQAAYLYGHANIDRDGSQIRKGSSGYSPGVGEWPIGSGHGTPIDHLALLTNVNIDRKPKIGNTWTDGIGLGMARARGHSEIAGVSESVTVPAGTFENCLFIRSEFVSSAENELVSQREAWEGYLAGTRLLWFAPGVGLVKCHYKHANGAVTDLHLSEYSVKEGNEDYIPLDVGNWWRHEWTEKKSRTSFMQLTRVVAEEKKEEMQVFHLSFMVRGMKMKE